MTKTKTSDRRRDTLERLRTRVLPTLWWFAILNTLLLGSLALTVFLALCLVIDTMLGTSIPNMLTRLPQLYTLIIFTLLPFAFWVIVWIRMRVLMWSMRTQRLQKMTD